MSAATDRGTLLALAVIVFCGRFRAIDEISTLATTESLVKHGDLAVEQVRWSASWTPLQNREGADGRYDPARACACRRPMGPTS